MRKPQPTSLSRATDFNESHLSYKNMTPHPKTSGMWMRQKSQQNTSEKAMTTVS